MYTKTTIKVLSSLIKTGYWTGIFPYKWNPKSRKISISPYLFWWKIYSFLFLLIQIVCFTLHFLPLYTLDNIGLQFYLIASQTFSLAVFSIIFLIHNLFYAEDVAQVLSTLIFFTRQQGKKYSNYQIRSSFVALFHCASFLPLDTF